MVSEDGVTTVTFDRPPANALTLALLRDLEAAIHQIRTDPATRVLVFGSSVPRMFIAGADLRQRSLGHSPAKAFVRALHDTFGAIETMALPTIAAIEGHALGGGCELALACDFRLMARGSARIGLPEVRLGLLAAGGGTQRLARLVGRAAATDLLLRGRTIDADEALATGLVNGATELDRLAGEVAALANELRRLPPLAVAAAKRVLRDGMDLPFDTALTLETAAMIELETTQDAQEGVQAFLEKRPGDFRGR